MYGTRSIASLLDIQHGDLRDGPAIIGAGNLELHHGDGVCGAAHDTQPAANTLFLVDNHVSAASPVFGTLVHRVALDDAREAFHADAVIRADVYTARAENTDGGVNHDIQLALQTAPRLLDGLFGRIARFRLACIAVAVFEWQAGHHLERDGFVIVHHTAPVVWQFDFFRSFGGLFLTAEVAVDGNSSIAAIADGTDEVARTLGEVAARKQAGITGHPGFTVNQWHAIALVDLQVEFFGLYPGGITVLAEGGNHGIGFDHKFATGNGYGAAAATGIGIAQLVANDFQSAHMHAVIAQYFKLGDEIHEFDMLKFGLIHFVFVRTHLFLRAAIEDIDFLRAETHRGAAAVHRGEATAQDDNFLADVAGFAKVGLSQQFNAVFNAYEVGTRDNLVIRAGYLIGNVTAGSQVDGVVLLEQVLYGNIAPDTGVVNDLDAQVGHILVGFLVSYGARQTPDRNAIDHDAAGDGIGFVDGDRIAYLAQIARAGQTGGTRAHNCHRFLILDRWLFSAVAIFAVIGGGAFQPADSDGFAIDFIAAAYRFAGTSASAPQHAGDDVTFAVQKICFIKTRLRNQPDIG